MDILDNIPQEELAKFNDLIRIYQTGEEILTEGEAWNNSLYVLRVGRVDIYRQMRGAEQLITQIEAVNIFGEMELVLGGLRLATIKAHTEVLTYKLPSPDLHALIANPIWGNKLINRLCTDIKIFSDITRGLEEKNALLEDRLEEVLQNSGLLYAALEILQSKAIMDSSVKSRAWYYLVDTDSLVKNYLQAKMPEITKRIAKFRDSALEKLDEEGFLPVKLKELFLSNHDDQRANKE